MAIAIARYTRQGFVVAVPLTDNARYDLVVDKGGRLCRVQVKTCLYQEVPGTYKVELVTSGGNRSWSGTRKKLDKSEFDELFIWAGDDSEYIFPAELMHGRASISLGERYLQYKVN